MKGHDPKAYPNQMWRKIVEESDILAVYQSWIDELKSRDIPYVIVNSEEHGYDVIEDETDLDYLVNGDSNTDNVIGPKTNPSCLEESSYSRSEIESVLRDGHFGYHRIELPYGLHTRGQDRSDTCDMVLPESLAGKTVLDVGAAHGYFCFEAEQRGASRVVGVDVRDDRVRDALLLKDIKGSNVDFVLRDIVSEPLGERFDYVLLLNVVHHLLEPIHVLRQLASITRERLAIEFPTLADPKFLGSLDSPLPPDCNMAPLIGVSSMRREVGQTFVFSPLAMERILLDHDLLFDNVRILESRTPGRAIALCDKRKTQRDAP
jgi:SAM-dependent methyltransferase